MSGSGGLGANCIFWYIIRVDLAFLVRHYLVACLFNVHVKPQSGRVCLPTFTRLPSERAEYDFGECSFKHRVQWVALTDPDNPYPLN